MSKKKHTKEIKDAQDNVWTMAIILFLLAVAVFDSVLAMLTLVGLMAALLFAKALIDEAIAWWVRRRKERANR